MNGMVGSLYLDLPFEFMNTITSLSPLQFTDDGKPSQAPMALPTRQIKGKSVSAPFMRRRRLAAKGIYHESSSGAQVFVPYALIDVVVEQAEPNYAIPKTS